MQDRSTVKELIQGLKSNDDKVRTQAWLSAGEYRARAIKPVALLFGTMERKVNRLVKQNASNEEIAQPLKSDVRRSGRCGKLYVRSVHRVPEGKR